MHPVIAVAVLPLLFFLPGFVTLWGALVRLSIQPVADDESAGKQTGRRPPDLIEGIGLSIAASFLISSLVAFSLVYMGVFSLWLLTIVVGAYVGVAALAVRLRRSRTPLLPNHSFAKTEIWWALGVVLIVCLSVALYSRPRETVLLIRDPATYLNTGVHIASTGGSLIEDELYYSLDERLQKTLVYERPVDSIRHVSGGYQVEYRLRGFPRDSNLEQTTPQFFNMLPTWLAIGYSMFGMWGLLMVSPLIGGLSTLLIFLVGRRLFGPVAGIAAAGLLMVNLAQFWYARTSSSELIFQLTFLAAVLFWALFSTGRQKEFGVFAGIGFGALIAIRIDAALVLGAILVFFLCLMAAGKFQRHDLYFLVPFVGVAALGFADGFYSSKPYVLLLYHTIGSAAVVRAMLVLAWIALLLWAYPALKPGPFLAWLVKHATKFRSAAALSLVFLAIFAYFIRPNIQETSSLNFLGRVIPQFSEESFVRLGWYLSPLGLAIATLGAAIAVWQARSRPLILFLLVCLITTLYYLFEPKIFPDHFWAIRRFVPITIPFFVLCIGYVVQLVGWRDMTPWSSVEAVSSPEPSTEWAWVRILARPVRWVQTLIYPQWIAAGLFIGLLAFSVLQIWEFLPYRDQKGSADDVRRIARRFPENSIIVFENQALGNNVAPALKLRHGLETFVLGPAGASEFYRTLCGDDAPYPSSDDPQSCIIHELLAAAGSRPLYWVSDDLDKLPKIVVEQFDRIEGDPLRVSVPNLEQTMDRLPKRSGVYTMSFGGVAFRAR